MREKTIENQIKAYVKTHPTGFVIKIFANAGQGKGTLDLIGSYRDKPFMVEVKAPDGKVSPTQEVVIHRAKRGGYVTGVVSNVAEFERLFDD